MTFQLNQSNSELFFEKLKWRVNPKSELQTHFNFLFNIWNDKDWIGSVKNNSAQIRPILMTWYGKRPSTCLARLNTHRGIIKVSIVPSFGFLLNFIGVLLFTFLFILKDPSGPGATIFSFIIVFGIIQLAYRLIKDSNKIEKRLTDLAELKML